MKKFLILLLAIFTCFNAEATIHMAHSTLPAKVAAANAARRQRERLAEKQQHEKDFHHGELDYDVQYVEKFTFKDSVPTIETYEIQNYYYVIDPDKCIIETRQELKSSRPATEQEIKKEYEIISFTLISFFVLVVISLVVLIGFIIYHERKKKLSIGYKEIC
jgi:hypothetical protein